MHSRVRTTLVAAAVAGLLVTSAGLAAADSLVAGPDVTKAAGSSGSFALYLVAETGGDDPVNNCNANGGNPVVVTFTSSAPAVVAAPADVQLTDCDDPDTSAVEGAVLVSYAVASGAAPGQQATITAAAANTGRSIGNNPRVYGTFDPDSITISVAASNTAPSVTIQNKPAATVEGNTLGGAMVTWGPVVVTDAQDSPPPSATCREGADLVTSGSTVFALGSHTVVCSATDSGGLTGNDSFTFQVVDTTPPQVTVPADITRTATGNSQALVSWTGVSAYDVVDGAVLATCTPPAGSSFPVGVTTVTCSAQDSAGNLGSAAFRVTVRYDFDGFFKPVSMAGANVVKAGQAVPIKFTLGGDQGLGVFAAGFPKSQEGDYVEPGDATTIVETITAGSSSLQYDPATGVYTYAWKTDKSWAGKERQFVMKLADGAIKKLNFSLTR
jgi:hypothetical protein